MITCGKCFLVEKQNNSSRSHYSLEGRPKIKNFKLNFLNTEMVSSNFINTVQVTTKRNLM